MPDVKIYQEPDGGNVTIENGITELDDGLASAAYLSMFGGNEDDTGQADDPNEWWGNLLEDDTARMYRGETETVLRNLPSIPASLRKVEEAMRRDLAWFLSSNIASSVTAEASIPGVDKVRLVVTIEANGNESQFEYVENWKATR